MPEEKDLQREVGQWATGPFDVSPDDDRMADSPERLSVWKGAAWKALGEAKCPGAVKEKGRWRPCKGQADVFVKGRGWVCGPHSNPNQKFTYWIEEEPDDGREVLGYMNGMAIQP